MIFIPPRFKTVQIEGEVNRSGIFELKEEETLTELIGFCGGLKVTAYLDRAQIDRIVPFKDRATLGIDRMYTDVNLSQQFASENGFRIQDGDKIKIFSITDLRQNTAEIHGQSPGREYMT